jgi:signal transduction histidine kinase
LLAIAVVFRLVGMAWLLVLSVLSLMTEGERLVEAATRPLVVASGLVAVVWTVVTVVVWRARPGVLSSSAWLALDLAVGAWVALVPNLADTAGFFVGGFPISSALMAATTRGVTGGAVGGAVIAAASAWGYGAEQAPRIAEVIAINLLAPVVVAWAFTSIRRNDDRRRTAEADLAFERAERARADDRAEVAAHLHDSVLQTLAMIQRRSSDPQDVARLARSQERELREWLNGADRDVTGLMDLVRSSAGEVERTYGVAMDVSCVGDLALDADVEAMAAAAREAMVNAAKFAGVNRVFVLAEARPGDVRVVVRDKGRGFDPGQVARDRKGISDSIVARMLRHGGSARLTTAVGSGTEVDLRLPGEV